MSHKKKTDPVGSTVRYEMMNYRVIPVGAYWYWVIYGDTVWYLVVLGHHKLVLFDTWW